MSEDYYGDDKSKKIKDFLIGFFGMIAIQIAISIVSGVITYAISSLGRQSIMTVDSINTSLFVSSILFLVSIMVYIGGIILAFVKGRRYIGIGILSIIAVALLIFGACFVIIVSAF